MTHWMPSLTRMACTSTTWPSSSSFLPRPRGRAFLIVSFLLTLSCTAVTSRELPSGYQPTPEAAPSPVSLPLVPAPSIMDACQALVDPQSGRSIINTTINRVITSASSAGACLSGIPFVLSRDLLVLDTVISGLDQFYIYKNIARSSPAPELPSSINIIADLKKFRALAVNGNYSSVFAFYEDIRMAVQRLNDGHTRFDTCLSTIRYLALPVVGVVEDGEIVVKVMPFYWDQDFPALAASAMKLFASDTFTPYDPAAYSGWTVNTINGVKALDLVKAYADKNVGQVRDLSTRLNLAFARPSVMDPEYGSFALGQDLPDVDFLTYDLTDPSSGRTETVLVPFTVLFTNDFYDSQSFFSQRCSLLEPPALAAAAVDGGRWKDEVEEKHFMSVLPTPQIMVQFRDLLKGKTGMAAVTSLQNLNPGGLFHVYALGDAARTMVVVYHTFITTGSQAEPGIVELFNQTKIAFAIASSNGDRILIDMTGNGGGFTSISWGLMSAIVGAKNLPFEKHDPYRFRSSSLFGEFYNQYLNLSMIYAEATSLDNLIAFHPEKHYAYGSGPNTTYTNDFVVREDLYVMKEVRELLKSDDPAFGDKPVLVLTNGFCFSACAMFTHVLKRHFGLEVVTVGGIPGEPIAISASCLGFTTSSFNKEVLQKTQALAVGGYPPPFQVNVDLGYAASAMYVNSDVPCEFVYLAPDNRINYTNDNIASLEKIWEEAAQYFPDKGMPLKVDYE